MRPGQRCRRLHQPVPHDCRGRGGFDRHEATHAINLFDMNQKYADVVPLAEVLEYLGEWGARNKGSQGE